MATPASDHLAALDLNAAFNADRATLPAPLAPPPSLERAFGAQVFRGMPFLLGPAGAPNVLLVDGEPVTVAAGGLTARYLVFVHYVADRPSNYLPGFADTDHDGNELGDHVADYVLRYADGTEHVHPIRRRFAIQQPRIGWGASPFAAVPLHSDQVTASAAEDQAAGPRPAAAYGRGETRHSSGRGRRRRVRLAVRPAQPSSGAGRRQRRAAARRRALRRVRHGRDRAHRAPATARHAAQAGRGVAAGYAL